MTPRAQVRRLGIAAALWALPLSMSCASTEPPRLPPVEPRFVVEDLRQRAEQLWEHCKLLPDEPRSREVMYRALPAPQLQAFFKEYFAGVDALYDERTVAEALRHFERAYLILPLPEVLREQARAYAMLGDHAMSAIYYERYGLAEGVSHGQCQRAQLDMLRHVTFLAEERSEYERRR